MAKDNKTMIMIRSLATLKGIAVMSSARRPTGIVEGPVGLWVQLPATLEANTGGARQEYSPPTVIASLHGQGATWQEFARYQASDLIFARSARGKTSSYGGIIYGLSADIPPLNGSPEKDWPALMAQLWNGLSIAISTDSGKSVLTVPLREIAVIAPNVVMAIDGQETAVANFSSSGACPRSGSPILPIIPAMPWTGQTGDDVLLCYSGPALDLSTVYPGVTPRIYLRIWMLAAQIDSTNMQNGDGGVSNLDPDNCRSMLDDREAQRMIARWAATQSGREDDGEA